MKTKGMTVKMKECSVCGAVIENEDAPVVAMGGRGSPRLLCAQCSELFDRATLSRSFDDIAAAMDEIGKKMADSNPDKVTYDAVNEILTSAAKRAKKIQSGEYDFSADEKFEEHETVLLDDGEELEAFDEIPEELAETEEDKELDRMEAEKAEKLDKFMGWVNLGFVMGIATALIWVLIDKFFL